MCPCIAMRRASQAVTNLYDLVLSPIGLKATQFITLQIVDSYGEERITGEPAYEWRGRAL